MLIQSSSDQTSSEPAVHSRQSKVSTGSASVVTERARDLHHETLFRRLMR
jgi:hypothetical protein